MLKKPLATLLVLVILTGDLAHASSKEIQNIKTVQNKIQIIESTLDTSQRDKLLKELNKDINLVQSKSENKKLKQKLSTLEKQFSSAGTSDELQEVITISLIVVVAIVIYYLIEVFKGDEQSDKAPKSKQKKGEKDENNKHTGIRFR